MFCRPYRPTTETATVYHVSRKRLETHLRTFLNETFITSVCMHVCVCGSASRQGRRTASSINHGLAT